MKRLVVGALVVALAAASGLAWIGRSTSEEDPVQRRTPERGVDPFAVDGSVEPGPTRAAFSSDGARLAVLGSAGAGIAERGKVRLITPADATIADLVWLPGTADIAVLQGPVADRLAIIGSDGHATGFVPVEPSLEVGAGHGITVRDDRGEAIVSVERREALSALHTHLVAVDLRSSARRDLTKPDDRDEARPFYVDEDTIIFTVTDGTGSWVASLDLATGEERRLSPPRVEAVTVGVVGERPLYASAGLVWAVPAGGGAAQELARLDDGETVAAIDPTGGRMVIAERLEDATGLRLKSLRRPD